MTQDRGGAQMASTSLGRQAAPTYEALPSLHSLQLVAPIHKDTHVASTENLKQVEKQLPKPAANSYSYQQPASASQSLPAGNALLPMSFSVQHLNGNQQQILPSEVLQSSGQALGDGTFQSILSPGGTFVVGMLERCEDCGKKFINSYYLEKHIRKRHPERLPKAAISSTSQTQIDGTLHGPSQQGSLEESRLMKEHLQQRPTQSMLQQVHSTINQQVLPDSKSNNLLFQVPDVARLLQQHEQQLLLQEQQLQEHQRKQQQILQQTQQQLQQQQEQLQFQQHLLQQQCTLLSATASKPTTLPVPSPSTIGPGSTGNREGTDELLKAISGTIDMRREMQKEVTEAVQSLRASFRDEIRELQQQLNKIEPAQHRDTEEILLSELKKLEETKYKNTGEKQRRSKHQRRSQSQGPTAVKEQRKKVHKHSTMRATNSASSGSTKRSRRSRSYSFSSSASSDSGPEGARQWADRARSEARDKTYYQIQPRGRCSCSSSNSRDSSCDSPRNKGADIRTSNGGKEKQSSRGIYSSLMEPNGSEVAPPEACLSAVSSGPAATREMQKAIVKLLTYSHREFMTRSQLSDIIRHNSKPPPDEVEKQLGLPPGSISAQLASHLLNPAMVAGKAGINTSNAPQNFDTLNLQCPKPHGSGGCCFHLHRPPPPPRAFSLRARILQIRDRLRGRSPGAPSSCPATQAVPLGPASAPGGSQTPRARWAPNYNVVSPTRLNGAPVLQQQLLNQLLQQDVQFNNLIENEAQPQEVQPQAQPQGTAQVEQQPRHLLNPHQRNESPSAVPPRDPPVPANSMQHLPSPQQQIPCKQAAPTPMPAEENWEHAGSYAAPGKGREKSKSIVERDIGTVIPALAFGAEETIPDEGLKTLPEPRAPFYPMRVGSPGASHAPLSFPPLSSWGTPEGPPPAATVPSAAVYGAINSQQAMNNRPHAPPSNGLNLSNPRPNESQRGIMRTMSSSNDMLLRAPAAFEWESKAEQNQYVQQDQCDQQAHFHPSHGYLPSARGSFTSPGDAGWGVTPYKSDGDLGPWQFAGSY